MIPDDVLAAMSERELRRRRPIDISRAYQRAARLANAQKWHALPTDLEGGMHGPPERMRELALLDKAALARKLCS